MDENKKAAQKKKISHAIIMVVLILLFLMFIFPFILVIINAFNNFHLLSPIYHHYNIFYSYFPFICEFYIQSFTCHNNRCCQISMMCFKKISINF